MATFVKRDNAWLCRIRRTGHKSVSRTFNTKADAERWASIIEGKMAAGDYVDNREALSTSLEKCLHRYEREISPHKKGSNRDHYRIGLWLRSDLAKKNIGAIRQVDVASWRDERLASGIAPSTVCKDLALLSHVFTIALKEWGIPLNNPVMMIRKPKVSNERTRRLEGNEEERILARCYPELAVFVTVALETAMRRSEIVSMNRTLIRGRVLRLLDTKNGSPRDVPLSTKVFAAINSLPLQEDGSVFTMEPDAYSKGFLRVCREEGIEDLRLHDLRHEATSRLFEKGLDVMQVKSITGHKTLTMLSRYTHMKADELARLLG